MCLCLAVQYQVQQQVESVCHCPVRQVERRGAPELLPVRHPGRTAGQQACRLSDVLRLTRPKGPIVAKYWLMVTLDFNDIIVTFLHHEMILRSVTDSLMACYF